MKKYTLLSILLVAFSITIQAQKFPKLDVSPMDVAAYPSSYRISNKLVKVIYSRPQLKGRVVKNLAPYEKVWRTGANEATEIIFYKDVLFGDKEIKAGRYTLFTIPNKKEWTIILNTAQNVWGSYFYKEEEDVARTKAKVSKNKEHIEAFSIVFDDKEDTITMHFGWGNTRVSLPIKILEKKD